MSDGLIPT